MENDVGDKAYDAKHTVIFDKLWFHYENSRK